MASPKTKPSGGSASSVRSKSAARRSTQPTESAAAVKPKKASAEKKSAALSKPGTARKSSKMRAKAAAKSPKASSASKKASAPRPGKAAETALRKEVISIALAMSRSGLSPGRSGNVSCRLGDGMLITPTGMPYEILKPADIVYVAADGSVAAKSRKPSSEWRFHLAAYDRSDVQAVVHTHSLNATVLACAHKPIPAFHYMVAVAGGTDVPLIPYAPFGTDELAKFVGEGLRDRDALLMANHGQIAVGRGLSQALELAHEIETLAAQYVQVLSLGRPKLLNARQMKDVLARFKNYGQNAQQG